MIIFKLYEKPANVKLAGFFLSHQVIKKKYGPVLPLIDLMTNDLMTFP